MTDRMTVALFDTSRGVNAWVFRETKELPQATAPPGSSATPSGSWSSTTAAT